MRDLKKGDRVKVVGRDPIELHGMVGTVLGFFDSNSIRNIGVSYGTAGYWTHARRDLRALPRQPKRKGGRS